MAAIMQPPPWSCTTSDDHDQLVVRPEGELDLACAGELRAAIDAAFASGRPTLVDLTGLTFIDSTGLSCLLAAAEAARKDGAGFELLEGPPSVMRLFELTGTVEALPFRRTS